MDWETARVSRGEIDDLHRFQGEFAAIREKAIGEFHFLNRIQLVRRTNLEALEGMGPNERLFIVDGSMQRNAVGLMRSAE